METRWWNSLKTVGALLLVLSQGGGVAADAFPFDYSNGPFGPDNWGKMYSSCAGKFQSPINIDRQEVLHVKLPPLRFQGFDEKLDDVIITNNGHTVMLSLKDNDDASEVKVFGGPLKGPYIFKQMHFHWGFNDSTGSEDSINNQSFPMELHMVFWKGSYGKYDKALEHKDGLTVLAFFYEIMSKNDAYDTIVSALHDVKKNHSKKVISDFPSLDDLLPFDRIHYYHYLGSLTTPPCNEIVTWLDFTDPIPLSHHQVTKFRMLMDQNHRPTQPVGERTIWFNVGPGQELAMLSNIKSQAPHASSGPFYLFILIIGIIYHHIL